MGWHTHFITPEGIVIQQIKKDILLKVSHKEKDYAVALTCPYNQKNGHIDLALHKTNTCFESNKILPTNPNVANKHYFTFTNALQI